VFDWHASSSIAQSHPGLGPLSGHIVIDHQGHQSLSLLQRRQPAAAQDEVAGSEHANP
jgi:hypothetical protein